METSMTDHSTKEERQRLQLPKNIRQIGNIQGSVRIYMEDYVYTYLHGNGRPGWAHRGSIFLGSHCQENGQKYIFISGLVQIPDDSFHDGIPEFTDLMWGSVYQEMKQFYENVEILGWGMDVSGASAKLTGDLERIHRGAFQSQDKILFLMDLLEKEEAFYVYEKNMLRRRDGYYVYYEKNPEMQEYMMRGKDDGEVRSEIDPQRAVVNSYRALTAEKNRKGKGFRAFVYVASLALLATVSAMGVNLMSSAGKIHKLEEAVSYLQNDQTNVESETVAQIESDEPQEVTQTESTVLESELPEGDSQTDPEEIDPEETDSKETDPEETDLEETASEEKPEEISEEEEQADTKEKDQTAREDASSEKEEEKKDQEKSSDESKDKEETEEPKIKQTTAAADNNYYVVQKGESLLGISQKIYGKDYTKQLCALNELEDENKIYEGQKLLLLDK